MKSDIDLRQTFKKAVFMRNYFVVGSGEKCHASGYHLI
jgi:hypothetical protein